MKMDWELTPEERKARVRETAEDGSLDEAGRMMNEVFPPKADDMHEEGAYLYYGWAIREAFLAGVRWERERKGKDT